MDGPSGSDYSTDANTTSFWDKSVAPDSVYYYRVTQLESEDNVNVLESSLESAEQVAGLVHTYQEDSLPPPQGFKAWASATTGAERLGIQLRWCLIPNAVTDDHLPPVDEYRVYRAKVNLQMYDLVARLAPACLSVDASGHPNRRCEINYTNWCADVGGTHTGCSTVIQPTTCTTPHCGIFDLSFQNHGTDGYGWPTSDSGPGYQSWYNFNYYVTAFHGSSPDIESMPSNQDEGWLNYCAADEIHSNISLDTCTERRDPEGKPEYFVCGDEDAQSSPSMIPGKPLAASAVRFDVGRPLVGTLAPHRVIGLPPVCTDCDGGSGGGGGQTNPYSPPSRFVFYHLDHLGSPRIILNGNGDLVEAHDYLPFGDERPYSPPSSASTKAFTGHERDVETGLDYMLARYYSSSLGRFMGPDPGFDVAPPDPQTWNKYTYTRNNPLKFVDPNGHFVTYADNRARKWVDSAMKVSPETRKVISGLARDHTVEVTFQTGKVADQPGQRGLGWTISNYLPDGGSVRYQATVIIDNHDIVITHSDGRTVVIHEVVGHLGPNSQMSRAEADESDKAGPEAREEKARELTADELRRIPEEDRPRSLPPGYHSGQSGAWNDKTPGIGALDELLAGANADKKRLEAAGKW